MKRLVLAWLLAVPAIAAAQTPLSQVRLDDRTGAQLPLDARFADATGHRIQLRDVFDGSRPTLLVLSYVRCRMLCSVVLHGAIDAVNKMPLALGRDYRFVVASIDPHEEAATAAAKLREMAAQTGSSDGLVYLLGAERPIAALADSVGFRYAWDSRTEQYAHPAAVFVVTPDGVLSRVVQGAAFDPGELAEALRVAARGDVAPKQTAAQDVLGCFRFDPAARAHRELIESYLEIGGLALSVGMLAAIAMLFLWERYRERLT